MIVLVLIAVLIYAIPRYGPGLAKKWGALRVSLPRAWRKGKQEEETRDNKT